MYILEKKANNKVYKMEVDFDDYYIEMVKEVLDCLKGKTISVPDPNKKWTPGWEPSENPDENEEIYNRFQCYLIPKNYKKLSALDLGLIKIPILEWLPVTCKRILFDNTHGRYSKKTGGLARVSIFTLILIQQASNKRNLKNKANWNKIMDILEIDDLGGEITIAREFKKSNNSFRFLIAHELLHAINSLESVYPAMLNYKGFLENIYCEQGDALSSDFNISFMDEIIDGYDERLNLTTLKLYFGSSVNVWHNGYKEFVSTLDAEEKK